MWTNHVSPEEAEKAQNGLFTLSSKIDKSLFVHQDAEEQAEKSLGPSTGDSTIDTEEFQAYIS